MLSLTAPPDTDFLEFLGVFSSEEPAALGHSVQGGQGPAPLPCRAAAGASVRHFWPLSGVSQSKFVPREIIAAQARQAEDPVSASARLEGLRKPSCRAAFPRDAQPQLTQAAVPRTSAVLALQPDDQQFKRLLSSSQTSTATWDDRSPTTVAQALDGSSSSNLRTTGSAVQAADLQDNSGAAHSRNGQAKVLYMEFLARQ